MTVKKNLFLLPVLLLLCAALACAGAETAPVIRDDADLLTAQEEAALLEAMAPVCQYGTPVFWSTNESGNYRSKAENYYYSMLGNDSGALFVVDMNQRQLTLLTNGEIRRAVSDGDSTSIVDNVYRLASFGDYGACAEKVFTQVHALLRGEQIARPMKVVSNVLLSLALALSLVYLYISRRYETRPKTGKVRAALPVTAAAAAAFTAVMTGGRAVMTKQRKTNISSSSGGHGHGGGFGGGGGGGGFSGGGGSHGF